MSSEVEYVDVNSIQRRVPSTSNDATPVNTIPNDVLWQVGDATSSIEATSDREIVIIPEMEIMHDQSSLSACPVQILSP